MEALLEEAKDQELWKYIFGPTAFTVRIIPTQNAIEDKNLTAGSPTYVQMLQTNMSIMLSLGSVKNPRSTSFDKRVVLRRTDEEGGNLPAIITTYPTHHKV